MGQTETLPLTYAFINKLTIEPDMTIVIALSELIDNSISSWIKGGKEKKLEILIKYSKVNNTYEIIDNAYGFESEEHLKKSMHFYSTIMQKENGLNNYGFGMKSAVFWIGKDIKIYTKNNKGQELLGQYIFSKEDDSTVQVSVEEGINDPELENGMYNYKHGTKIYIGDVFSNSSTRTLTESKRSDIENFLGYRYANYLNEENVDIKIKINDSEAISIEPNSHYITPKKYLVKSSEYFSGYTKEELEGILRDNYIPKEKFSEFYEKFMNDDYIMLENDFLEINDKISFPVKFFINKNANKKFCGVNILEKNRYLCHPADIQKSEQNSLSPYMNSDIEDRSFLQGHCKWGLLEIKIDEENFQNLNSHINENGDIIYYIYPEKNKKTITFNPEFPKDKIPFTDDEFKMAIRKYYKDKQVILDLFSKYSLSSNEKNKIESRNEEAKKMHSIEQNTFISNDPDYPNEIYPEELNEFIRLEKKVKYTFVDEPDKYWVIQRVQDFDDEVIKYKINRGSKFILQINDKNKEVIEQSYIFLIYLDLIWTEKLIFKDSEKLKSIESVTEALGFLEKYWHKK